MLSSSLWEHINLNPHRRALKALILLLFSMALFQSKSALGQTPPPPWTNPDASGNIQNQGGGNVGINIPTGYAPQKRLHIVGDNGKVGTFAAGLKDFLVVENAGNSYASLLSGSMSIAGFKFWKDGGSIADGIVGYDHGTSNWMFFSTAGSNRMTIDSLGNVGITGNVAMAAPSTGATPVLLDLNGGFFHTTFNTPTLPTIGAGGGLTVGWNRSGGGAEVNFYNVFNGNIVTAFQFSKMINATTVSDLMTILGNGNVGIGTANPTSLLHVTGSITAAGLNTSGSNGPINAGSGAITLGTVTGTSLNTSGNGPINTGTGAITSGSITSSGNISALNGTIQGNNVIANYQDVAEWVPASMKMQAGTVVVIDARVNNHVSPCSTPYDTRVAGVISTNPGVILGQRGEDKVMVATTGRVRVRVDATRAPIRVGDLLVTSDKEGVAMRSMPVDLGGTPIHRPGTLIGKALEPLASGTGEILVLLSLQ